MPLGARSEVDPELLALPDPPRARRTAALCVLSLAAAMALWVAASLRHDVAYALSPASPLPVGPLSAAALDALPSNRVVSAEATLALGDALRFEHAFSEARGRVLPVLGRDDVWVEFNTPLRQAASRFEPPAALHGRLVRFADAGPRHQPLADALAQVRGAALPAHAMLLVQGEEPADTRGSVWMAAVALLSALWCALASLNLVRPARG